MFDRFCLICTYYDCQVEANHEKFTLASMETLFVNLFLKKFPTNLEFNYDDDE